MSSLNDKMEFDHVVRVDENRNVTDAEGIYAPSLNADELDDPTWSLLDGYSGQDRYSGPMMHASEFIGGQMERDILSTPGLYVTLVNYSLDDDEPDSWAVAFREDSPENS